jgi:flagellar biosynthesis GTPase FlhF
MKNKPSAEDKAESTLEEPLSAPLKTELKTHPILYFIAALFIGGILTAAYFGNSFQEQQKTLLQSQVKYQEEQNRLIKQQLETSKKQTEDAKEPVTPASKPTSQPAQQKATTPAKPTCNTSIQERQRKFMQAVYDKTYSLKVSLQSQLEVQKSKLLDQSLSPEQRSYITGEIGRLTIRVSDEESNMAFRKEGLANISKCVLYNEDSLKSWSGIYGVIY